MMTSPLDPHKPVRTPRAKGKGLASEACHVLTPSGLCGPPPTCLQSPSLSWGTKLAPPPLRGSVRTARLAPLTHRVLVARIVLTGCSPPVGLSRPRGGRLSDLLNRNINHFLYEKFLSSPPGQVPSLFWVLNLPCPPWGGPEGQLG